MGLKNELRALRLRGRFLVLRPSGVPAILVDDGVFAAEGLAPRAGIAGRRGTPSRIHAP
jgi:hypothetical protein